jgi:hypothetical protein
MIVPDEFFCQLGPDALLAAGQRKMRGNSA